MVDNLGVLGSLQELVDQVYHFKDHYFEDHDLEEAAAKSDKASWQPLNVLKLPGAKRINYKSFCLCSEKNILHWLLFWRRLTEPNHT
jgi:hypothetical protein